MNGYECLICHAFWQTPDQVVKCKHIGQDQHDSRKPREFWISTNTMVADLDKPNYTKDYYAMYKVIHVREVMPNENYERMKQYLLQYQYQYFEIAKKLDRTQKALEKAKRIIKQIDCGDERFINAQIAEIEEIERGES